MVYLRVAVKTYKEYAFSSAFGKISNRNKERVKKTTKYYTIVVFYLKNCEGSRNWYDLWEVGRKTIVIEHAYYFVGLCNYGSKSSFRVPTWLPSTISVPQTPPKEGCVSEEYNSTFIFVVNNQTFHGQVSTGTEPWKLLETGCSFRHPIISVFSRFPFLRIESSVDSYSFLTNILRMLYMT